MTNTIDRIEFEQAVQDITDEDSIRTDYSGRAMYGRTCIGLTVSPSYVDRVKTVLQQRAEEIREECDDAESGDEEWVDSQSDLADALENMTYDMRTDNMGMDMIVYWPGWEFSS
jgi:hypothetical protein